ILDARFDESLGDASSVMPSGLPVVETGPAGSAWRASASVELADLEGPHLLHAPVRAFSADVDRVLTWLVARAVVGVDARRGQRHVDHDLGRLLELEDGVEITQHVRGAHQLVAGGGVVTVHGVDELGEEVLHDGVRFLLGGFGVRTRSGVAVRIAWSRGCHIGPGGTGLREAVRVVPWSARSGSAALSSPSPVRTSTR